MEADFARQMREHTHNGVLASKTDLEFLDGLFETVSAVPSATPQNVFDQVKIYISGSTRRLYMYSNTEKAWRYTALT